MSAPAIPLKEFDIEMAATRRLLERVPNEKGRWKPHDKSFALGDLALLVASIPGWIARSLRNPNIDLAAGRGYTPQTTERILAILDENVEAARAALTEVTGKALDEPWSLQNGAQVLFTLPRGEVVRQHLSHMVHHRGQLTVYLRLVDVPLPQVYGPTADEKWTQ